jgi:membrane protease YdiL (CAAX protease family)
MDEYNTGMDAEVKVYFRKIMKSFSVGLLWLMLSVTMGLFLKFGHLQNGWRWENYIFYGFLLLSLLALIRYFYNVWRKKD